MRDVLHLAHRYSTYLNVAWLTTMKTTIENNTVTMDNTIESNGLKRLYLTGVKPNGKDIGVGAYGKVFEVEYCGGVYAAKEIHSILVHGVRREEFEATKKAYLAECIQSSMLSHPNVVQFLGVYNPGKKSLLPVLVMESMEESLASLVKRNLNILLPAKLSILFDISKGLWYLHSHEMPIVHRDLSPNNILLTDQLVAKISDLGVAKVIQADSKKTKTRAPGTVDFMPPEALLETPEYGTSLDIFSYGGLILHVINQEWPTPLHYVETDSITKTLIALSEAERRREHIKKMPTTPADLLKIVKQCLDNDPQMRPAISDVSRRMRKMVEENKEHSCVKSEAHAKKSRETTEMLKEATLSSQAKKVEQPEVDLFNSSISIKWKEVAPLPVCCTAAIAVVLLGSVYVGSGREGKHEVVESYRLDVYNLVTNRWSSPVTTPHCDFAMTVLDDKLLIIGGATRSDNVTNAILALDAGEWNKYSEMPTARYGAIAAAHQSILIVAGGIALINDKWTKLSITELLDTTNGNWYTCSNLPSPYCDLRTVVIKNTLYLLGGSNQHKAVPDVLSASLSNLSTHQLTWHLISSTPWCGSAPVVLYNKYLVAIGGRNHSNLSKKTSQLCALDMSGGVWKPIANLPQARSRLAAVGVADNKIICIGGALSRTESQGAEYSSVVWIGTID